MNKTLLGLMAISFFFFQTGYYGSTTAPVTLAGGIIKSKHKDDVTIKYKRKDCPVCKGKGWYMSGDDLKKIDCQYCEPDTSSKTIKAPPAPSKNCPNGICPTNKPKGK